MCVAGGGMLSGLVGGMSSIMNYDAQVEDYNAEVARWETNYKNSLVAGRDQMNQLTLKAIQTQDATTQKLGEYNYEGAIKSATAEASAAGAGVGGNVVDDVIRGIQGQAARNRATAQENGDMQVAQIAEEQKGVVSQEANNINSVSVGSAPNPASAFLGVAGAVLGGLNGNE